MRRALDEELQVFASKVIHKEGRTKNRTDRSSVSAMREFIALDEEIKSARNVNATYDNAVDRIGQVANERILPGFQRQQENYKHGHRFHRSEIKVTNL